MPEERGAIVHGLGHLLHCSLCIGISHIIENADCKLAGSTRRTRCDEAEDIGFGSAVRSRDLVVVCGIGLEASDLDVMEELAAHLDLGDRARGCAVVATQSLVLEC